MEKRQNKLIKKIKEQYSGITLIALVITIIVLLILAGVTIATLTGDNGLLSKATNAKEENEKNKELEQIKLAVSAAQVAGEGKLTAGNLENELRNIFGDNGVVRETNSYFSYNDYRIYKEDGKIEKGKLLPDEFQQVEYIKSTGTQFILLDYFPTKDTNLTIKGKVVTNNRTFWGIWDDNGTTIGFQAPLENFSNILQEVKIYYADKWGNISNTTKSLSTENYTIEIRNGIQKYNSEIFSNETISNTNFSNNARELGFPIIGGAYLSWSGFVKTHQIISEIIWKDEIHGSHYFIPCYRKNDNTIGFYDSIEERFYTNQGTGIFEKGIDV